MEKKAMINIRSVHYQPNDELLQGSARDVFWSDNQDSVNAQRIDIDYEGVLKITESRYELEYSESELTGMEGARTAIAFELAEPSIVSMSRSGTVTALLCFEAGQRIISSHSTEEMDISIGVDTYELENKLDENGGELKIRYGLEFRGSLVERVSLHVKVNLL